MKKLIMTAAVVACASIVSAQVFSDNIVGYNKDIGAANSLHISGAQFGLGTAKIPSAVFGTQLPVGSKLYVFTGSGYDIATFIETYDYSYNLVQVWDPDNLDLSKGFWVENTTGAAMEAIIAGEVPAAATTDVSITTGLQLLTYPYPVSVQVQNMGFSAAIGDKIYVFTGSGYDISTYIETYDYSYNLIQTWDPATLQPAVGEGFWYEATAPQTWTAPRNFTP